MVCLQFSPGTTRGYKAPLLPARRDPTIDSPIKPSVLNPRCRAYELAFDLDGGGTSASGELVLNIFSSLAQFERRLIQERTNAGLAAARARGRKGGRPALDHL